MGQTWFKIKPLMKGETPGQWSNGKFNHCFISAKNESKCNDLHVLLIVSNSLRRTSYVQVTAQYTVSKAKFLSMLHFKKG